MKHKALCAVETDFARLVTAVGSVQWKWSVKDEWSWCISERGGCGVPHRSLLLSFMNEKVAGVGVGTL